MLKHKQTLIFSLSTVGSAALIAGPSVLFSFLIGGDNYTLKKKNEYSTKFMKISAFSCVITGFVYAEYAVRIPVAGK